MKILITGFEPFGGEKINPAFEAVKNIKENIKNAVIVKKEIPTVFSKSISVLDNTIEIEQPDIVLCIGQAGGISELSVERVAININDARIKDNEGNQPIDEKIFSDGENAYFANIPIKAIVEEIKKENIPASVSNSAGTYVCNNLMYGLLYLADKKYKNLKGGFIHVPFIPEQVIQKPNTPSMNLSDITHAIETAIYACLKYSEDIKIQGGAIY